MPRGLELTTRWVWRLVLLGGFAYLAVQVLALLWLVVVPILAATLLAALLRGHVAAKPRQRRVRLPHGRPRLRRQLLTLLVLTLFVTFFFLKDGERIWRFLTGTLPGVAARRLDEAGRVAWSTLTGYVHGTVVIAVIHTIVIGGVAFLLGVPLVAPIAVVVFLGSFLPIIGALIGGGIGVLITLGTQGWVAALILLAVLVVEDQLESHLLQPLIVGRYVRLHPLAIGLALAVGTVLGGVIGAIVSVPVAAIGYRAGPVLLGRPATAAAGSSAAREGGRSRRPARR